MPDEKNIFASPEDLALGYAIGADRPEAHPGYVALQADLRRDAREAASKSTEGLPTVSIEGAIMAGAPDPNEPKGVPVKEWLKKTADMFAASQEKMALGIALAPIEAGVTGDIEGAAAPVEDSPEGRAGAIREIEKASESANARMKVSALGPQASEFQRQTQGAAVSLGTSLEALGLSLMMGPSAGGLALGFGTGGSQYLDARDSNISVASALVGAAAYGAIEAGTEAAGIQALFRFGKSVALKGFKKSLTKLAETYGIEVGSEELATIGQNVVEIFQQNPNMTKDEFLQSLLDTAVQTTMVTAATGGLVGAGAKLVQKTDIGIPTFRGHVEAMFPEAKVTEFEGGANVEMPSGKTVEVHTEFSPKAPELRAALDESIASNRGGSTEQQAEIASGEKSVAGVLFKVGQLVGTENDLIYLTGREQGTDLTTLPHEKGELVLATLQGVMTPQEMGALGLPETGGMEDTQEMIGLRHALAEKYDQYVFEGTPSPENPMSPLDKAFHKVVEFADATLSAFGHETQRSVFQKMHSGEISQREGAVRIPGESEAAFKTRTVVPRYMEEPRRTKSGVLIGTPYSHQSAQAREGLIRRWTRIATDVFKVNPEAAQWYERIGEKIRELCALRKNDKGEWTGNITLANQIFDALAMWSPGRLVKANFEDAMRVIQLVAEGKPPAVSGTYNTGDTMARNYLIAQNADEFSTAIPGVAAKVDSIRWDYHNATFQISDSKNAAIDRRIIASGDLRRESGVPYESFSDTQYGWVRSAVEEVTRRFNKLNGTGYSARQVQALIWDHEGNGKAALPAGKRTDMGQYIGVGHMIGEFIPATNSDVTPWIHSASMEQKKAYSRAILDSVILDEFGRDKIMQKILRPGGGEFLGVGTWEGAVNPNFNKSLWVPGMSVDDFDFRVLELYSNIFGYITTQNAVLHYLPHPDYIGKTDTAPGVLYTRKDGIALSESDLVSLYKHVRRLYPEGVELSLRGDGIVSLDTMGMGGEGFRKKMEGIANAWGEEAGRGLYVDGFGVKYGFNEDGSGKGQRWSGEGYLEGIRRNIQGAGSKRSLDLLDWTRSEREAALQVAEGVAPTGVAYQSKPATPHKFSIKDFGGKDISELVALTANSYAKPIRTIMPDDRIWLLANGKAVFLGPFDLHDTTANRLIAEANGGSAPYHRIESFGGSLSAIRFHGTQFTENPMVDRRSSGWGNSAQPLAFEIFRPMTKEQRSLIQSALGARKRLLVDITNPDTGDVIGWAQGAGQEGFKALLKAEKKAYSGVAFQTTEIETPAGAFPEDHNGWKFEGEWPGMGMYQYSKVLPDSPLKATLYAKSPDQLAEAAKKKEAEFAKGGPSFQTKFFSPVEQIVERNLPDKINGNELIPLLKKFGAKDAEVKDLNLGALVKPGEKIAKADLLDYIRTNSIKIEEVTKGVPTGRSVAQIDADMDAAFKERANKDEGYDATYRRRYNELMAERIAATGGNAKFSQYTLPGGVNYRELLLTVPESQSEQRVANFRVWMKAQGFSESRILEAIDIPAGNADWMAWKRLEHVTNLPDESYLGPHWDEPNVLAHIRFNDRTGPNGERLLHIEEFQSDWANAMRDKEHGDTPAMPFSGDWKELVAKRMLIYAAQNGYDGVTWVTGQQTADRYDLSKQVSSIEYEKVYGEDKKPTGQYEIIAYDLDGQKVLHEDEIDLKRVDALVGKSVAEKIAADEGSPSKMNQSPYREWKSLSGVDLKVGGEWASKLYDSKFVSIFNKLGKKYGVKAGEVNLELKGKEDRFVVDYIEDTKKWVVIDERDYAIVRWFAGEDEAAQEASDLNGGGEVVHHLPVTPAMQKDLLVRGLPLYQTKEKGRFPGFPNGKGMTFNQATSEEAISAGKAMLFGLWNDIEYHVPNDETEARAINMIKNGEITYNDIINHRQGENWKTREHGVAATMLATSSWENLLEARRLFFSGEMGRTEAENSLVQALGIVRGWYWGYSEAGGTLQSRQRAVNAEGVPVSPWLQSNVEFMKELSGRLQAQEGFVPGVSFDDLMDEIGKMRTPEQARKFAEGVDKVKDVSALNKLFYFSLLSNPVTQMANLIGNVGPLFIGVFDAKVAEMLPGGKPGMAAGMAAGMYHSLMEAFILAKRAALTGESSFGGQKFEGFGASGIPSVDQAVEELKRIKSDPKHPYNNPKDPGYFAARKEVRALHRKASDPITAERVARLSEGKIDVSGPFARTVDFLGSVVDLPFLGLTAGDEFFKVMNERAYLWGRAYETAVDAGLSGDAFNRFVAHAVEHPSPAMNALAEEFADKQTFTSEPGYIAKKMLDLTREYPAMRLMVPFVRIVSNITRYNLEHTPVAPLLRSVRDDISAGGRARQMALARMATGASAMAIFGGLAAAGMITGGGPLDYKRKKWMRENGWQEYSIKVGGKFYSYKRIEPVATLMGIMADIVEIGSSTPEVDWDEYALIGTLSAFRNVTSKTWMEGFANTMEFFTTENPFEKGTLKKGAMSLPGLLVPSGIAQAARIVDPVQRDVREYLDKIKSRTPGLSADLEPMRNLKGDIIVRESLGLLDLINPVYTSADKNDPVYNEIIKNKVRLTMPSRYISGGKPSDGPMLDEPSAKQGVPLPPKAYWWLVRQAGNDLKEPAGRIFPNGLPKGIDADRELGAWDTLTLIVQNKVPATLLPDGRGGLVDAYYKDLTDGPDGSKALVIQTVLMKFREAAKRQMLDPETTPFTPVAEASERKKIRRKEALIPQGFMSP